MRRNPPARGVAARPRLRAALAAFAILVNAALPAGWERAFAGADPLGDSHAICLAGGGIIQEIPPPEGAPDSTPEGSLHCHACLLPAPVGAAAPAPCLASLAAPGSERVRYELAGDGPASSAAAAAFDARAPPV